MVSSRLIGLLTSLVLALADAIPVGAQAPFGVFDKVLSKVEGVGVFGLYGGFAEESRQLTAGAPGAPTKRSGLRGMGFESSLSLGAVECEKCEPPKLKTRRDSLEALNTLDTLEAYSTSNNVDCKTSNAATCKKTETEFVKTRRKAKKKVNAWSFQLGVGYSQLAHFSAASTKFRLHADIREVPSIAFYGTLLPANRVNLYVGFRTGLVELHSLRAYSIEWEPVSGKVPDYLPRDLNLSVLMLAFGVQLSFKT